MISFYPGPSKVYEQVPVYVKEAYELGVLSINHRSDGFVEISKKTISLLKEKLNVPEDYTVFFTSSATECWEIIAQSLVTNNCTHFFNGAFGQKWFDYSKNIIAGATYVQFDVEEVLKPINVEAELICLTQNETSNGTQLDNDVIENFKAINPDALIAVDATSSMAGVALDFTNADVWFASVQKCFGLPAGMALLFCSPKAVKKAIQLNKNNHYNSLTLLIDKMRDYQTSYTPNVLSIYLLMRTLEVSQNIIEVDRRISNQFIQWTSFINKTPGFDLLIKNESVRSKTVIPLSSSEFDISEIKSEALKAGFLLGNGYGNWNTTTFRVSNFPAINLDEIEALQAFLAGYQIN